MVLNTLLALAPIAAALVNANNICGVTWDVEGCGAALSVYTGTTRFAEIPTTAAPYQPPFHGAQFVANDGYGKVTWDLYQRTTIALPGPTPVCNGKPGTTWTVGYSTLSHRDYVQTVPYLTYTTSVPQPTPTVTQFLPATTVSVIHTVTETVTITPPQPPPPPPVCRVIVPWVPFNILRDSNHNLQPYRFVRDIPAGGAWLVVTDTDWRNARYKVTVDGQFLGDTSDFPRDPAHCIGGDDCLKAQFSNGRFPLAAGNRDISISILSTTDADTRRVYFPAQYELEEKCW